jgi:UDP-2-acetamido-3-amino-2,3-dideoxy-glucuronate N-acetyltransferase
MLTDGGAVHPQAVVADGCSLGDGTFVWQFASVIRGAVIGQQCSIGACAIVDGAQVGDNCKIGHGASLHPGTRLGDDIFVGPGAVFCNDLWPRTHRNGFDMDALKTRATVIVEDGASIGARAVVLPGIRIGRKAMVAAGVVCDRDVPEGMILRRSGCVELMPQDDGTTRRMRWAQ